MSEPSSPPRFLGWREWVELPALSVGHIKAKIDTGARTSAIHAFFVEPFEENGCQMVRFGVHPLQRKAQPAIICTAKVEDQRIVSDSGGHRELRYVIRTPVRIGDFEWEIESTLTNRDTMLFRFLLGRNALHGHFAVDPARSYVLGKPTKRKSTHKGEYQ